MVRVLMLLGLLGAGAAAAQSTVVSDPLYIRLYADATRESYRFRETSTCNDTIRFSWTYQGTGFVCGPLKLWGTQGDCGEVPATGDKTYPQVQDVTVQTAKTGTFDVVPAALPGFAADAGCGAPGIEVTHRLCAAVKYSTYQCLSGSEQTLTSTGFEVVYDALPPAPPVITETVALDRAARLAFTIGTDVADVTAEVQAQGSPGFVGATATLSETENTIRIGSLVNGTTYDVRLFAVDQAGNVSAPSELTRVTPIRTVGFWGVFREQGGTEQGGCAAAGGAPLLLLALAALRALGKRRSQS